MDVTITRPHNEDNNSPGSTKNYQREENSSLVDANDVAFRANPTLALNPPPPPLPGVFIFDRPNQQHKPSYHVDIKSNVSTESYNNCKDSNNLLCSESSFESSKALPYGQSEHDVKYSKANVFQSASAISQPTHLLLPAVSEIADSMLPPNTGIQHVQTLEPITLNSFEDSLQPPGAKAYHQLHAISPNHYNVSHEPKMYHEMTPVSLTSTTLHQEDFNQKNYEQLNPVPVAEGPTEKNKTFQELKPVATDFDNPQYCNSKLYQQLCQPPVKEDSQYELEDEKYQQLRPATVIDFEQSSNQRTKQTTQQQLSNNPKSIYPTTSKNIQAPLVQDHIRDSVINKVESSKKPTSHASSVKYPPNSSTLNHSESHLSFKEDKPKVYLELRNPSIRSQMTKSLTHYNQSSDTLSTSSTSLQTTPKTQNPPEFKLPGPYEFNLPKQNSPNKYKLPKILGHNEYSSPGLIFRPKGKGGPSHILPPLSPKKSVSLPPSSQIFNRNTSFNGIRSKVALSLPKTQCYGDLGVSSKVSYYPNQTTAIGKSSGPSVNPTEGSHFEKNSEISAPSQNTLYPEPMTGNSKLREELLKPIISVKKFENMAPEGEVDKSSTLKDYVPSRGGIDKGSSLKDVIASREDTEKQSPLKNNIVSRESTAISFLHKDNIAPKRDKGSPLKDQRSVIRENVDRSSPLKGKHYSKEDKGISILLKNTPIACSEVLEKGSPLKDHVGPKGSSDRGSPSKDRNFQIIASKDQNVIKAQLNQHDSSNTKSNQEKFENINNRLKQFPANENSPKTNIIHVQEVVYKEQEPLTRDMVISGNVDSSEVDSLNQSISNTSVHLPSGKDLEGRTSSPDLIINQRIKFGDKKEQGSTFEPVDGSQNNQVGSNEKIINVEKCNSDVKDTCQSNKYTPTENDIVNTSQGIEINNTSLHGNRDEKVMEKSTDEATKFMAGNEGVNENSLNNDYSGREQESYFMEVKKPLSDCKEIKVRRKYTRRIVPEIERRKPTKRKASLGVDDVVAREKRRYKKRNVQTPMSHKVEKYNYNEVKLADVENLVQHQIKESFVQVERIGNNELSSSPLLSESAPRIKRKYTRRKFKIKYLNDKTTDNNGGVKRRVGRPPKEAKRRRGRPRKEVQGTRVLLKVLPSVKPKKVKHKFVDPLEEGLITDDEDEAVFLGFDMTDEEDETILGFEVDSEEESEYNHRPKLLARLAEADCMTVECDPRSILQPANDTVTCSQCGERFHSHMELVSHMQWHSRVQTHYRHSYVCAVCYRGYPTQLKLERHMKLTHEGGKRFKCAKCPKMFTTKAYAKIHARKAHRNELMVATTTVQEKDLQLIAKTVCKEDKEEKMETTAETVHKEEEDKKEGSENIIKRGMKLKTLYCSECTEIFQTMSQLREHENKIHNKPFFQCEICLRNFPRLCNLQRHKMCSHRNESVSKEEEMKITKFYCAECTETFQTMSQLREHENKIHNKPFFQCEICLRNFPRICNLQRHKMCAHREESVRQEEEIKITKFYCAERTETFETKSQLREHESNIHNKPLFQCEKCLRNFPKLCNLQRHKMCAHREESVRQEEVMKITTFYCAECSETFQTESQLKEHENKMHNKPLFQCEKCLRYFQKLCNLQKHKLSHTDDSASQDFPCAYCNEKFSSRESLHAHWPIHTEKKVFTCDICNSHFTAMNSLKRHRILHTGEKLFRCEICQRSFSLLNTLKTHLLIHTGARKFECKLCGKAFNRKDVLNAHQWIHTGEKKFQCEICLRKFRWKHAVKSHKLIYHSTEKPYVCQTCGKSFSHPDSFKKHAQVHADRLFYCQLCLKSFSRASTLKAHIATHTDLKPFFCDKCHKGFRSKSHLRNHLLVHTKEKHWLCKFCDRTFKDRIQLQRHKRVVHFKNLFKKILSSFPEDIREVQENFEAAANVEAGLDTQTGNSFEEDTNDPSNHFISLPAESDFPQIEENIVPPSVF